jgi:Zn-dependent peptidase ImmA (M78 family)
LTWHNIRPEKIDISTEENEGVKRPRVEQLADNFAAALLMPGSSIRKHWQENVELPVEERIVKMAQFFNVSGTAMFFRLKNLGLLDPNLSLSEIYFKYQTDKVKPRVYSEAFVKKLYAVIDKGFVSLRKAAELLNCNIEDIQDLFKEYRIAA